MQWYKSRITIIDMSRESARRYWAIEYRFGRLARPRRAGGSLLGPIFDGTSRRQGIYAFFGSRSDRDAWVASREAETIADPGWRDPLPASDPEVRRYCRKFKTLEFAETIMGRVATVA
jgi:hypothetical protein